MYATKGLVGRTEKRGEMLLTCQMLRYIVQIEHNVGWLAELVLVRGKVLLEDMAEDRLGLPRR